MTYLAIGLGLSLLLNGVLVWLYARARDDEMVTLSNWAKDWNRERQTLLNRIQAPELGVAQSMAEEADGQEHHIATDGSPYEDQQWDEHVLEGLRQRGIELDG